MPNLDDNQKQPAQTKEDWTDNLLVKDKTGKFHYLDPAKSKQNIPQQPIQPMTDDETKVKLSSSPINDNFVPVEHNISGRFDDKAAFAFHPEDEEQVKTIAKALPQDNSKKYSVDKIVDKLVEKQTLKFDNENRDKFTDILHQFFRGRRKAPIVREILSTKILSGGKKLTAEVVDNILSIIKGIKNKIDLEGGLVVRQSDMPMMEEAKPEVPAESPIMPPVEPQLVKDEFENVDGNLEADKEIQKALSEIAQPSEAAAEEEKSVAEEPTELKVKLEPRVEKPYPKPDFVEQAKVELKKEVGGFSSLPKVVRPGQAPIAKKQLMDVVAKKPTLSEKPVESPSQGLREDLPKPEVKHVLSGPIQELQDMSLKNFHRLGNSAQARADKILEKIGILEQESYTKKAQGIEAWRKSETYKTYLDVGAQSMIENRKIDEIAAEKTSKGEQTLSSDEFDAISDLNKKLRF